MVSRSLDRFNALRVHSIMDDEYRLAWANIEGWGDQPHNAQLKEKGSSPLRAKPLNDDHRRNTNQCIAHPNKKTFGGCVLFSDRGRQWSVCAFRLR
jgi:hypothetical protein